MTISDICSRKSKKEERIYGPTRKKSRSTSNWNIRLQKKNRNSPRIKQQLNEPIAKVTGYRRSNTPSNYKANYHQVTQHLIDIVVGSTKKENGERTIQPFMY